jgi:Iap family predicted aminopeptidase
MLDASQREEEGMHLTEHTRDFISRCVTEQDAWSTLRRLCEEVGARLSASAEERRATDLVVSEFRRCGLEASVEEFRFTGWKPGESHVTLRDGGRTLTLPSHPLGWSPGRSVKAPVVDVGRGGEADFRRLDVRGKIVLVCSENPPEQKDIHRSHKYAYAEKGGAAGFLFYDKRPGGLVAMGSACLEARPGTIPAAGICYEDAMLVSAKAGHATVEIAGTSSFGDAVSSNGIGLKRGESDEEIVVCGHIDSWFSVGAVDNGSGVASVVELARLLCRYPLKRTVRFVSLGSEEVGLLGSQAFVATHADISRVVLVVNLDCPTLKDSRLTVFTNETPALHSFMEEIVKALHVDVELSTGMSRYSDHVSFRPRGVAGVHLLAGSTTSGFGHTEYDSLDKIRPEDFTIPLLVAGTTILECAMRDVRFPLPG